MVCLCIEAVEDVGMDERWQQYWYDNGEQLVWNNWLQKYPEYTGNHSSAAALTNDRETSSVTCQLPENTDTSRNEREVLACNECNVDSEIMTSFVNGESRCSDSKHVECSHLVDCESRVEADRQSVNSRGNAVDMSSTENDNNGSLAADVLRKSPASDITDDQVIVDENTCDAVGVSDGADVVSSWDSLWKQHYAETYWYYYDWFMQWLQEESEMSQPCSYTLEPSGHTDSDVQLQIATEPHDLADELSPSSHTCTDYVATSQESLSIVENLLSEMLLSVVGSVEHHSPADGNGQKHKRKKGKQHQHGLFDSSDLSFVLSEFLSIHTFCTQMNSLL